jgi:RNA polymerase sigma-70 factor (ECF subfamily)
LHFYCISMYDCELILWNRVRADDTKAFESLFKQYYPKMCLFSKQYTHDITTSREIVQDVFIYLWENRKKLEIKTSVRSYLASAVRYNSIRRIESDSKITVLTDILPEQDVEFYDHLEYAELQNSILKAIELLPQQCQRVFLMSRFEQMKYSEIAALLKISVKTVEAHMTKALRMLQDSIRSIMVVLWIISCHLRIF